MAAADYFSLPIFFIVFRETTEASIIVSVLLSFLSQVLTTDHAIKRRLQRQVWAGALIGLLISLAIGAAFIVVWNKYGSNLWASNESIWEGSFSLLAVVMITIMGVAMLRTTQIQEKWKGKLAKAFDDEAERGLGNNSRRYALFILPFITVLREGLEAIVFIGGVTFSAEIKSIPAAVVAGVFCGFLVGYIMYRGGNMLQLHRFFVVSTCFLLIIAAGLVAKGIAAFEANYWDKLIDAQSDDLGYYDPNVNVWALNCCNPNDNTSGGWQLMNAILGWSNVADIGTIVGYILYWLFIIAWLVFMKLRRRHRANADAAAKSLETPEELSYDEKEKEVTEHHHQDQSEDIEPAQLQ
ncbi:high-affinity iron transporter [Entomortierella parvispora]|uniref:High-affinity iron transporter n=1 Tax=Entomortierella parvispora TaxID=205924 RepID=A0A9P3M051_9FUNG|nr:high-affinity iron transporter [Entomortierella parvispora]